MISIRKLEVKDIPYILEWMKDPEVNMFFRFDPEAVSEVTVRHFIASSFGNSEIHFAVVNDHDEYLGTISLKNIDRINLTAEYAISLRKNSHGTGCAAIATNQILEFGFKTLGLHRVYLNVYEDNVRARKFYEKFGFVYEGMFRDHLLIRNQFRNLCWYGMLDNEYQLILKQKGV